MMDTRLVAVVGMVLFVIIGFLAGRYSCHNVDRTDVCAVRFQYAATASDSLTIVRQFGCAVPPGGR